MARLCFIRPLSWLADGKSGECADARNIDGGHPKNVLEGIP
jgi:hypothetical protein